MITVLISFGNLMIKTISNISIYDYYLRKMSGPGNWKVAVKYHGTLKGELMLCPFMYYEELLEDIDFFFWTYGTVNKNMWHYFV
jgi:hypothetical protein